MTAKEGIDIEGFTQNQPIIADIDGDLKPDLLGMGQTESGESLQMWKESKGAFERCAILIYSWLSSIESLELIQPV